MENIRGNIDICTLFIYTKLHKQKMFVCESFKFHDLKFSKLLKWNLKSKIKV